MLRLEAAEAEYEPLGLAWLNDAERRQLDGTKAARRRRQFLAGHWLARRMSADVKGGTLGDWSLDIEADGRRRVTHQSGSAYWTSISHWTDWVACALAEVPVGLDVQGADRERDLRGLAREVLSPSECAEVEALQGEAQSRVFYRYWTLKEARAKQEGIGLRPELARDYEAQACESAVADALTWQADEKNIALCFPSSSMSVQLDTSVDLGMAMPWRFLSRRPTISSD